MKKPFACTALIAAVLALSLSGCVQGIRPSSEEPSSSSQITKQWIYNEAIDTASELYSMFDVVSPDVNTDESVEKDGYVYYRIADERFLYYSDMKDYMLTVFSSAIVDRLLDTAAFRDIGGYTYIIPFARGTDSTISSVAFGGANSADDGSVTYTASVTYDSDYDGLTDSNSLFVFKQEMVDGRLVFTEFPFFW